MENFSVFIIKYLDIEWRLDLKQINIFYKQRLATHHTDGDVYLKPTLKFCNAWYVEEDLICIKVGIYYFLMCSINGTYNTYCQEYIYIT